jgi:hypothetical protein
MRLVSKRLLFPHGADRAPLCGFITYISKDKPVLLRRMGYEIGNDIHDAFSDSISRDNGESWSEPRKSLGITKVSGGYLVHTENAALYHAERNLLIHFTNDKFEPDLTGYDNNYSAHITITVGEPLGVSRGTRCEQFSSHFGFAQGIYVSFCTPFLDSRGRVIAPVQWQRRDPSGTIAKRGFPTRKDMPDVLQDVWEVGILIGEFDSSGTLRWRVSQPVPYDFDVSSRGMCEPTIAELPDGRLFMIVRGSNAAWPDKPGYKWLTFSTDRGETWSKVVPLPCDDGSMLESSATGSALFRSIKNGRLYWIGNLCTEGRRPHGNLPRSPLHIAEIQEDPVAIQRETITVIDRAQPGEDPDTQHSNFKFYQDRATGDVFVYLTRYGQRGYENTAWILADLYEYRLAL